MTAPNWPLGPILQAAREGLELSKREAAKRAAAFSDTGKFSEQLWRRLETGYYTVQGRKIPLRGEDGQNAGVTRETAIAAARAVELDPNKVLAVVGLDREGEDIAAADDPSDEPFKMLRTLVDTIRRAHGDAAAERAIDRLWRLRHRPPNAPPEEGAG